MERPTSCGPAFCLVAGSGYRLPQEPPTRVHDPVQLVRRDPFPVRGYQACACHVPAAPRAMQRRLIPDDAGVELSGAVVRALLALTPAGWS